MPALASKPDEATAHKTAIAQILSLLENLADTPQEGTQYDGHIQSWDEEGLRSRLLEDLVPKAQTLLASPEIATLRETLGQTAEYAKA